MAVRDHLEGVSSGRFDVSISSSLILTLVINFGVRNPIPTPTPTEAESESEL